MTGDRLAECLGILGWSREEMRTRLGITESTVRRWCSGARPIPDNAAAWLELLAARMTEAPSQPADWQRDG